MELLRQNKGRATYAVVQIAKDYGHEVLFTPPYHPELQPIEKIWGVAKNMLRQNPCSSPSDLIPRLNAIFRRHIHMTAWLGARRSACRWEKIYLGRDEDIECCEDDAADSGDEELPIWTDEITD